MKLKLAVLLVLLAMGGSLYGQGTPVQNIVGSGVPGGTVATVVGTDYVDISVTPNVVYKCTSISVAAGPTPPAGTITCNWTQIGGGGGITSVSSLPATCTPGVTANVQLSVVPFGEYQCGPLVNQWYPLNAQRTISPFTYGAKADVKYTYSAQFTLNSGVVTCSTGDCAFQCPGGVYPCTAATNGCASPSSTCDVGKIAFGTTFSPFVGATASGTLLIAQTTIASVQSLTQATTTATASAGCTLSTTVVCGFAWGSQDDATAINSAATAAWSTPGICSAVQLPAGQMFIGSPVMNVTVANLSSACGGLINTGIGSDANQVGPEVYGQGPNNSVLIPLPNFNFANCTNNSLLTSYTNQQPVSVPICNGSTPNLEAHDFGINGLGQSLSGTTQAVTLWGSQGWAATGLGCTGSTLFNVSFSQWGSQLTNSLGLGLGANACGDPTYTNIVSEAFGAINCEVMASSTVETINGLACFGATVAPMLFTDTGIAGVTGGIVDTYGSYFAGMQGGGPTILIFKTHGGSGQNGFIWNSSGDFIDEQFTAGGHAIQVSANGGGASGTANLFGDNILLNSATTSTSDLFFLNGTAFSMHVRNSTLTATGANNREIFSTAGNNFFDDGGNTVFPGTTANSISGQVIGEGNSANATLVTAGKLVLSAGWGTTAAVTALLGGNAPIQFTVTNSGTGQGASPTIAYTFPTPYLVAPLSCSALQTGGTNTVGTFTSSALSATGVTFTFSLTPTAGSTEIVQVTCVTP